MRQEIKCSLLPSIFAAMAVVMRVNVPPLKQLSIRRSSPMLPRVSHQKPHLSLKPLCCSSTFQEQTEPGITCEPCNGKGWLVCDFCKGQKTNIKAENKRIYRRCPSCRAIGYVLCTSCKVFKCVTFPNYEDGAELSL
ncbi:uncharacterized protein LOC116188124 isoform X2 [Punica granatum]|uniref:Uncharacterized protein LOC116188124 isoform X2 n=1 Tax=Punica granatum TaxID=22663 RepID=A0A6P8BS26_PUNGR|nr:uncharacterized protein LOC116188124 isoform X2 [Punica granatum]